MGSLGSETHGTNLPPFPDDVPVAPLLRISLAKLISNDTAEIARFAAACEELGFFYLDLTSPDGPDPIISDANALFSVSQALYDLPLDEKQKYDFAAKNSYFGYKGAGAAIVNKAGDLDRNEFYNVSKDDILGLSDPLPAPDVISRNRDLFKSFITRSHHIVLLLLDLLNAHLELPRDTLRNLHRLEARSGDQVRMVKALPQPADDRRTSLGEHTDFGSVTILFNRLGGLQILPPGENASWCYVKPLSNHCIVNLGDAMVKFTNGLLRSNIHRVVSPPGVQGDHTRYSLVYFNRPENDVILRRLEGSAKIPKLAEGTKEEQIKSQDWILRRAMGHRVAIQGEKVASNWEATRGTEATSQRLTKVN